MGIAIGTEEKLGRRLQVVATRGSILGGQADSGAVFISTESRMRVKFGPKPVRDIRLLFQNVKATGSAAEQAGVNTINVSAAIEKSDASKTIPFTFPGGSRKVALEAGTMALTQPKGVSFTPDAEAFIRTGVDVAAAGVWPRTSFFAAAGLGDAQIEDDSATATVYGTGTLTVPSGGATAAAAYIPTAILGYAEDNMPAVGIWGDSNAAGTVGGETTDTATGARGMVARALWNDSKTKAIPYVMAARATEQMQWNVGFDGADRRSIFQYVTHVIGNFSTNDIAAGRTYAQLTADLIEAWRSVRVYGCKIWWLSCLPRTNAGNTAPSSGYAAGALRDQINQFIRNAAEEGLIDRFIDLDPIAASGLGDGLWVASGTTDGVHPTAALTATLATYIRSNIWSGDECILTDHI